MLGNDTDVDGDPLSVLDDVAGGPSHGTLTFNTDGSFIYIPAANFNGTDSFFYAAFDGDLVSGARVTINVTPVNDAPPAAADDSYTTAEDTPLTVAAPGALGNDTDVDGDALVATGGSGPSNGTLTLNPDGSFTYTPAPDFNGTDSFTYTASDGNGGTTTATVTISVTDDVADLVATQTDVIVSSNPAVFGQPVELSATVEPVAFATGTPTGSVEFFADGQSVGSADLDSGQATLTVSDLAVGSHAITATYQGDAIFLTSTSGETELTIAKADTSVVVTPPSAAVAGQPVALTANVEPVAPGAGTPTGTVEFFDGDQSLGTAELGSPATLATSALGPGTHQITASYEGDATFEASTSAAITVSVAPAGTPTSTSAPTTTSTTTTSLAPTTTSPAGALPVTGSSDANLTFVALGVLLTGLLLNAAAARSRRHHQQQI